VTIPESIVPPREWLNMDIIAEGNHTFIKVNGKTTVDYLDPKRRFASGHIALQQHDPQTVVEFRKIEIKELSPSSALAVEPPVFVPLFNGKDLTGWTGDPSIWRAENGAIVAHGERNPGGDIYLVHQRDYTDFELMLQFKLSNQGNSGVQFRSTSDAVGVAEALEFKIVHRNISPSNILVRSEDRCVKLGDLMLAKALDETGGERITCSGEVVGDLRYLSLEQLSGEQPIDARADIYGLGATLYAILTGRPPFEGGTAAEVIRRVFTGAPEPPTKFHLAIPSQFEGLVLRMLSTRPEDRPESATRLRRDLDRVGRFCGA
jgi:serine/threonine protein kinase